MSNLSQKLLEDLHQNIATAMAEDVGTGDVTASLIPSSQTAEATIISREPAIICGIPWADACFAIVDANIKIDWLVTEGEQVRPNQTLCNIAGSARHMLTAERPALNFLQTLSATATQTKRYVDAVAGTQAQIMDTRKTIPGLRLAQKYAVTVGGGYNQRIALYDGILIKENHIAAAGGVKEALIAAEQLKANVPIQIEVESIEQLEIALSANAKLVLLDNFNTEMLKLAVALNKKRAILEASGGISLNNIREIALTGVDRISIGSLTKNIQAIDLSMRFKN